MAARYFFNCDQLVKVVLLGTCFLGPVQYDRSFHGKHSKVLNMEKHSMFSAMQSERDNMFNAYINYRALLEYKNYKIGISQ